jgi:hypothetical protein
MKWKQGLPTTCQNRFGTTVGSINYWKYCSITEPPRQQSLWIRPCQNLHFTLRHKIKQRNSTLMAVQHGTFICCCHVMLEEPFNITVNLSLINRQFSVLIKLMVSMFWGIPVHLSIWLVIFLRCHRDYMIFYHEYIWIFFNW